jgi:putative IMPACT (imprinted ancient) family translation regulator
MANLDSFIQSTRPFPRSLATSPEIRDRGSTFNANVYRATSPADARTCINHLKHVVHATKPASHEIAAWRCMSLKNGRTGLEGEDDFELQTGSEDDGENWAGGKVLKVSELRCLIVDIA